MPLHKKMFKSFAIGLLLVCPLLAMATPPTNLHVIKKGLVQYHDSGQYEKDIHARAQKVIAYIQKRVSENKASKDPKKLAAVFDIDETALSNYPLMVHLSFGGTRKSMINGLEQGDDQAIPDVLAVYNAAKQEGVSVFFVTGRPEDLRVATVKNLESAGYQGWSALVMEPNTYDKKSAIPFKSAARKNIEQQGYDVILSIGDQESDLKGGYVDQLFKLPNPYYYIA